ncbi:MAG TPA: glycosyltransferase family 39 protein [Acidimicrobiales bacterium]|nr:glycosyltransferase family 39 protein [Acidimicrobiales bacterium]
MKIVNVADVRVFLRRRIPLGLLLFLLVAAIYVLTTSGEIQTIDIGETLDVAQNMVRHGSFAIPQIPVVSGGGAVAGVGGQHFAPHGIGMSLLFAPIVLLLDAIYGVPHSSLVLFSISFVDPLLAAVGVVVLYLLARDLDVGEGPAIGVGLLFAFASTQWAYAHVAFDAIPSETFLLIAIWCLYRFSIVTERRSWWLLCSGAALGFSVLIRAQVALAVPFALCFLVVRSWPAIKRKDFIRAATWFLSWGLPLLGSAAVVGWFDLVRFGSILNNGHNSDPNTALNFPLLSGLHGLLASPGKSIFLFAPAVVLGVIGTVAFFRKRRLFAVVVVGIVIVNLLLNAKLHNWPGDEAWGPRFLVPFVGLAVLPAAFLLVRWNRMRWLWRSAIILVGLVGVGVQLLANAFNYLAIERSWGGITPAYYWSLSHSQFALTVRSALRVLRGEGPYPDLAKAAGTGIPPGPVPRVDLWWVLATDRHVHVYIVYGLVGLLLALAVASMVLLVVHFIPVRASTGSDHREPVNSLPGVVPWQEGMGGSGYG